MIPNPKGTWEAEPLITERKPVFPVPVFCGPFAKSCWGREKEREKRRKRGEREEEEKEEEKEEGEGREERKRRSANRRAVAMERPGCLRG